MSGISSVGAVSQPNATDPAATVPDTKLQDAFAKGIVEFMGMTVQSAESDIQAAANDTTSDPDAPS